MALVGHQTNFDDQQLNHQRESSSKRSPETRFTRKSPGNWNGSITEELKPGDLLPPERELVQMLGVSRGSVRDAIRSLELIGLLEPRQGIGTVVCGPGAAASQSAGQCALPCEKRKMIAELLDVRKMIEPPLARRAALHAISR